MTFETVTLGDISINGKGSYGIAASAVPYSDNLYTYLRITDINDNGTLNKQSLMSVDNENAEKYILKPNDIVFARTGGSTGRNYFYDGRDGKFVYAGFLIKFSIDENMVNPKFIKYYCLSDEYKGWVRSFNTGSTRGNINAQTYANMPIKLPSRTQQDLLVRTLSVLDDKIELNNRINENLESQAQAIFKSWFVDFEPFGGVMPENWKVGSLSDIADVLSGKRPPMKQNNKTEDVDIPLVGAAAIMGYTNKFNHDDKILVIGRVGTHGIVQRFDYPCWTSDNTLVIKSNCYEYIYQILKLIDYKAMNRGSTQPLITQGDLKKTEIIIPSKECLQKYEDVVGSLMYRYSQNRIENEKLALLRDTLLPKLMNGEIDVSKVKI